MKLIPIMQRTPAWHAYRAKRISGSTAAGILGVATHKPGRPTPLSEWLRLTGRRQQPELSGDWLKWGTLSEPFHRALYSDKFPGRVIHSMDDFIAQDEEFDWLCYSPDGEVADGDATLLLELKAPSPFNAEWAEQIPLENMVQVQIGMSVMGYRRASVSALIWPGIRPYEIERDAMFIEVARAQLAQFMDYHVAKDIPPHAVAGDTDREALRGIAPDAPIWEWTEEIERRWNDAQRIQAELKARELELDAHKNRLAQLVGAPGWREAKKAIEHKARVMA